MKLIVAGSRTLDPSVKKMHGYIGDTGRWWTDVVKRFPMWDMDYGDLEIVSGTARGVDLAGERWANQTDRKRVTITRFPADWNKHGKLAGHLRNRQMAEYADAALLIWDGSSSGTANMAIQMLALDKPVRVITLDPH